MMLSPVLPPKSTLTFKETEELLDSLAVRKSFVKSKLDSLVQEHSRLDSEYNELEKQYYDTALLSAQRQSLTFAKAFTSKLPLELRDLVYAEVWDDPLDNGSYERSPSVFGHRNHTHQGERSRYAEECKTRRAPWVFRCEGEVCQCFSWRDYSIWLQPRFVGMQVAMEAAAAYYRIMPIENPRSLQHLHNYLVNDQFHLGVRPVDHVRRIYLTINSAVMALRSPDRDTTSTDYLLRPSTPLHVLREIPVKMVFHLVLRIECRSADTEAYLEALRPVVGELKDAGARVQVMTPIRRRDNFSGHAGVNFDGRKHFDTSDYYDLPSEEWKVVWQNISEAELAKRKDVTANEFISMKARRRRFPEDYGREKMIRLGSVEKMRPCDVRRRPRTREARLE